MPPDELRELSQQAIDATSTAYTQDASLDVGARLREEMSERGLDVDDDAWIDQVSHAIRSGHGVRVDPEAPSAEEAAVDGGVEDDVEDAKRADRPGSLGGDNGGA